MTKIARILFVIALFGFAPVLGAQTLDLVIDDYNTGDLTPYFQFQGGEPSILSTTATTPDGSPFALQFETDGDEYGGFTGFGRGVPGAPYNTSGLVNPYLIFDLSANVPMTVEINLQTAGDAENRNALVLSGTGTYQRYALPFSSFLQSQANPFDPTMLNNVVFAIIGLAGDGNPATAEAVLRLDNLEIWDAGSVFTNDLTVMDFDDGDLSPYFFFAGAEGIASSTTASTPDGSALALHGEIDGDEYGGFAGFGRTLAGAPVDVSTNTYFNFYLRTNGPGVLEVNLQNDPMAPSGPQESREAVRVEDTGGAYRVFSLPLDAFIQTTAMPFDPTAAYNAVFVFVQLPGDANPSTTEFTFDIDDVGFSGSIQVPVELIGFDATVAGSDVMLNWSTASETNNAGFEVQQRRDNSWNALGFVPGAGTTTEAQEYAFSVADLGPGIHVFRLKQIDFDGAFEFSPEVEATVGVPGTHVLSSVYPNPFNPQATFTLAVSRTQQVRADLFDTLGRRVATIFEGTVDANVTQTMRIDGTGLASGAYVVRLSGETFVESTQISLLR